MKTQGNEDEYRLIAAAQADPARFAELYLRNFNRVYAYVAHRVYPDPDYSEKARKACYQGVVAPWLIVDANGSPRGIRVQRSLGMGLDQKAIEAVSKWRFQPAR